jgi:hypothetical protein
MSPAAPGPEAVAASAGGVDRAIVPELLSEFGDGDWRDMVAQLEEMAADIDQITDSESHGSRPFSARYSSANELADSTGLSHA